MLDHSYKIILARYRAVGGVKGVADGGRESNGPVRGRIIRGDTEGTIQRLGLRRRNPPWTAASRIRGRQAGDSIGVGGGGAGGAQGTGQLGVGGFSRQGRVALAEVYATAERYGDIDGDRVGVKFLERLCGSGNR